MGNKRKPITVEQTDAFTSIYRKDFPLKTCEIPSLVILKPDYPDILRGANMDYLLPDENLENNCDAGLYEFESGGKFYNKLVQRMPTVKRHVPSEVNQDIITRIYKDYGRTMYQVDFCKLEDGFVSPKTLSRQRIKLPPDWGDPPLTVQRKSYRDPRKILRKGENIISRLFKPPPSELVQSAEIQEILQIRTGETEYQSHIGLLGHQIVKDKLFGTVEVLPNEYVPPENK